MIELSKPQAVSASGQSIVWADIDGLPVTFSSRDAQLRPSAEAFASAMLIPTLDQGEQLRISAPLDRRWRHGAGTASRLVTEWWSYPARPVLAPRGRPRIAHRSPATGLCFTLGVDSFHALLFGDRRPDVLCFIQGYDIPENDHERGAQVERRVRAVASALDRQTAFLRSNLRVHPAFAGTSWVRTHGGALAAAGHLLSEKIGTLLIAATFPAWEPMPWGSHPALDPCWSSRRVRIHHVGNDVTRGEKIRLIAHEPLVQEHLRVCWENRTEELNCSRCDKCTMTMVVLDSVGALECCRLFAPPQPLPALLDEVPRTDHILSYRRQLELGLRPEVRAAVSRLLERSAPLKA